MDEGAAAEAVATFQQIIRERPSSSPAELATFQKEGSLTEHWLQPGNSDKVFQCPAAPQPRFRILGRIIMSPAPG